jgi:DNA-binding protein YbaB
VLNPAAYRCTPCYLQKLVKSAAENGNREVFDLIIRAQSIQEDPEELEEAVGAALKVAAGEAVP